MRGLVVAAVLLAAGCAAAPAAAGEMDPVPGGLRAQLANIPGMVQLANVGSERCRLYLRTVKNPADPRDDERAWRAAVQGLPVGSLPGLASVCMAYINGWDDGGRDVVSVVTAETQKLLTPPDPH